MIGEQEMLEEKGIREGMKRGEGDNGLRGEGCKKRWG